MTALFFFIPFPVRGYRLIIGCCGESESQWRCPELSLWVLIFMLSIRLLGFILPTSGFSGWPEPGTAGSFYGLSTPRRLRRRPGYYVR